MRYTAEIIEQVWEHGRAANDRPATKWRMDACGAWMLREQYGHDTEFGWKIEPVAAGDGDAARALRPFHHANGFNLVNGKPRCTLTADRDDIQPTALVGEPRNRAA
jgi:hypothetical protein